MMKSFNNYITELFDKSHPWESFSTGGNHWMYRFAFGKLRRGVISPAPMRGDSIVKFYEKQGLRITGKDRQNRPLINGKDIASTPLTGAVYEVGFHTLGYNADDYSELFKRSSLEEKDKYLIWEIYFARRDSILKWGGKNNNWYWDYDRSISDADEDLGIMGAAEAATILSTIVEITKSFVDRVKPKGILLGTKIDAKEARNRIYAGLAKRNNSIMIRIPYSPRPSMSNANMLWFDKSREFDPIAKSSMI